MIKKVDYFQMRAYFYSREKNRSIEFKLSELEGLWFCSQKNAKRKLKQLEKGEDFVYTPGKGRGNLSIITYKRPFLEEIEEEVDRLILLDHPEDVIHILQLPIPKTITANSFKKIQSLFGQPTQNTEKDILRTIVTRKITTLDPLYTSINIETVLLHQLGDTLVTYNQENDHVLPHLAHSWDTDPENRIWTFYLRKNVRFHNLHYLTSEDVKYTIERLKSNSSTQHWLVENISHIKCPSPYTVQFVLTKSNPFFARFLCSHNLVILPKNEPFDEYKWTGTGPFQLKKRTDNLLVLEAFDDYFLARPLIDEIHFYQVPYQPSTSLSYDIDGREGKEEPLHKLSIEVGFRYLAFNFNKSAIIQSHSFRKAIYHLFDIKKMWHDLGKEEQKVATSYFHWQSDSRVKIQELVPELLRSSGYSGEKLTLYTTENQVFMEMAEWLQKEALQVGLRLEIKTFTLGQIYEPFIEDADLLFMGEVASNDHHLSFMGLFLNKSSIINRFFSNEQLTFLNSYFDQMKQEQSFIKRSKIIEHIEAYIREQHLFLYLYHPIKKRIFHSMISNIEFDSYGYVDFSKLWIK